MGSLTAANAVLMLSVPPLFPIPQQLQGFTADDVFSLSSVRPTEVLMGVDGVLSGGFVWVPKPMQIMLQADSASNDLFDVWSQQQESTEDVYPASGIVILKSIGTKFVMTTGFLTEYKPGPDAKKLLQSRRYEITWESVIQAPA